VVPALYNLSRSKVLPEQFALIGVARSDGTADSWRERLHDMLKSFVGRAGAEFNTDHVDEDAWARLADAMTYISGDLTKPDLYEDVRAALDEAEKAHGTRGNAIFYLAVADRLFGAVVEQLGKAKLTDQGEDQNGGRRFWRRVVIEKPSFSSVSGADHFGSGWRKSGHSWRTFKPMRMTRCESGVCMLRSYYADCVRPCRKIAGLSSTVRFDGPRGGRSLRRRTSFREMRPLEQRA
jgi:glucose-6-phosphate 1-dehydrogenase